MNIKERYNQWLESPVFDEKTKNELRGLSEEEIRDRFYCDLTFGTSGVRGLLGAGTNRMNIYLIRRLSYSLGKAILAQDDCVADRAKVGCPAGSTNSSANRGVVIAHDSRRFSKEFALETALVLNTLGIKAYLFDDLRPTPELSFAVRYLDAIAGVMITASHNPKEYNGYKVYWEDGAQIPPTHADKIIEILDQCGWDIPVISEDEALERGLLLFTGDDVDKAYRKSIRAEMLHPELAIDHGKDLSIVYTPLHGAGRKNVQKVLRKLGFVDVTTVSEQEYPDTEFSTVPSPNPEDKGAWKLALKLAKNHDTDLLLATDPDADRLGVQCKTDDGYYHFTGNQIGILLMNYILETSPVPDDGVLIQNIVSTAMAKKIADDHGVELRIVPVGFKFIGEQIKEMETSGKGTFLFGFEESIGYLKGTYTRDKDAVLAAALVAEAALYYKINHGKTLYQVLQGLFEKYGYFIDRQESLKYDGYEGQQRIKAIMEALKADTRTELAGMKIVSREFKAGLIDIEFGNGSFIKARPSGTEPKVRIYFCIGADSTEAATAVLEKAKEELLEII